MSHIQCRKRFSIIRIRLSIKGELFPPLFGFENKGQEMSIESEERMSENVYIPTTTKRECGQVSLVRDRKMGPHC